MSVLASSAVEAQETKGVHYKICDRVRTIIRRKEAACSMIFRHTWRMMMRLYYLVYKLNSQNQLGELPNTGSKNEMQALVAGASLAALGILIFAVSKKKS